MITGFQPFYDENSKILVLGSFPSVISRRFDFYYHNPRNRFFPTLAYSFNKPTPTSITEKKQLLTSSFVALWDVVESCEILGSKDSSIKNYRIIDLDSLMSKCKIERILLNGKLSTKLFLENFPSYANISVALPSTSPANTRFDPSLWQKAFDLNQKI